MAASATQRTLTEGGEQEVIGFEAEARIFHGTGDMIHRLPIGT